MATQTNTIFGITTQVDYVAKRQQYAKDLEAGNTTPKAYWELLKITWAAMTDTDKAEEQTMLEAIK